MVQIDTNNKDDDQASNVLEHFSELEEVLGMIDALREINHDSGYFEKAYERFSEVVGRYQEQPHLLDPHLPQLLAKLLAIVRDEGTASEHLMHAAFKYLYQLSKVRTHKVLVKFLPHEINDIDFVLNLLERQSANESENWESRYFLLLWLSILVLNPFHMSRLDAFSANCSDANENHGTVRAAMNTKAERIFQMCTKNCNSNDACATMAAYLSSKYVIRVDLKDSYLPKFLDWIIESHKDDISTINSGQLLAIAAILKHGKREDLMPHAERLLTWCLNCGYKEVSDYLKQKYFIKIIQRLGLVFMKPRLACWRYQRGSRSLSANLQASAGEAIEFEGAMATEDNENDMEVPKEIEDIIEELLQALRNPSGDSRWSAAKGIGRVTNRLPKDFGDEIVGSVIEIFSPLEPHDGWHGACLAIAELAKRGLLLTYRLEEMVPILIRALVYDEMRGYMSVGQHIRDAACYMSWAIARAYEPHDLQPFIHKIATGLLITTVFDREINCRRAASAAFQESVGRLGNFPHGIDILVVADFYSVGMRSNSFLVISDYIAQYEEYTNPLIDHLIEKKINHWDMAIREITAKSLFKLTKRAPKYVAEVILPVLFQKIDSIDVNLRHGAIIAIGEIVLSLSEIEHEENKKGAFINEVLISFLNELVVKLLIRDLFRGLSGDIMNQACSDFIRNCSQAKVEISSDCLVSWQDIIDSCIIKKSAQIRDLAILALQSVCQTYYNESSPMQLNKNRQLVEKYRFGCTHESDENVRMGYLSALGALPDFIVKPNLYDILSVLMKYTLVPTERQRQPNPTLKWSEARRDAIKSITRLMKTVGFDLDNTEESLAKAEYLNEISECLLKGMEEYTIDDRGDIGAWVREAAMNALFSLLTLCPSELLQPQFVHAVMNSLAQQAVETIDRTRALAGNIFCQLVHWQPTIPHIIHHSTLKTIFPEDHSNVLWLFADHTFPMFCQMLSLEEYTEKLILGLVASIGKLSESLMKHSSSSLFQYLRSNPQHVTRLCDQIVVALKKWLPDSRVSHPFLNFLDLLISSGSINAVLLNEQNTFGEEVFQLIKIDMKGQKNVYKLASCASVFCHLIQIPRLCTKILSNIAVFLGQPHTHVRKTAATKLYEAVVLHGDSTDIPEENIDEILNVLSETDWSMSLTEIRPIRNNLCNLLGIKAPVSVAAAATKTN